MKRRSFGNLRDVERERRLFGLNVVTSWLAAQPGQVRAVHYDPAAKSERLTEILRRAAARGIELHQQTRDRLSEMAPNAQHQGIVAVCRPFPYLELDQVLESAAKLIVVADHIQDPHNLGAIIRSAEAAGAAAIVIPQDRAAPVTAVVEMAAAGATALLPVVRVTNVARTLDRLKTERYWVAALVPRGGTDLYEFDAPTPLALVIGGEVGVHALVQRQCDFLLSIPMSGRSESLNASVAAAVALFEVRRRWRQP
jgi:23S rRNA (guanosine2251-2'-O)-methyltransferase